jgi:hypothetical protein
MKNKNLIIAIVVIVIIILAVVFFLMKDKKTAPGSSQTNSTIENQTSNKTGVKESLMGLLQSTSGIKCSVKDADNGTYTIIAKGDKAKIEGISFASPQNPSQSGKTGTMINDGTWAYIWSGQQGMKFNLEEAQKTAAQGNNPEEKQTDWKNWAEQMQNSGAKYDCNPTVASDADFTPPSDVAFQDLDALMKSFQQGNPQIPPMPK